MKKEDYPVNYIGPNKQRRIKPLAEVVEQAEKRRRENLIRQSVILGVKVKVGDSTWSLCKNLRAHCRKNKNHVPVCGW